ncbi:hypothetical protein [Stenotrophomonas maltophilia]|nr:hypothetical protein [Stenotrophomonas maltophilia]
MKSLLAFVSAAWANAEEAVVARTAAETNASRDFIEVYLRGW